MGNDERVKGEVELPDMPPAPPTTRRWWAAHPVSECAPDYCGHRPVAPSMHTPGDDAEIESLGSFGPNLLAPPGGEVAGGNESTGGSILARWQKSDYPYETSTGYTGPPRRRSLVSIWRRRRRSR